MFNLNPYLDSGMSRAIPTPIENKVRSAHFKPIEPSSMMSNFEQHRSKVWITIFCFTDVLAYHEVLLSSPNLVASVDYPLLVQLEPCNPKSIEPTNYKGLNIINNDYKYASKKIGLNSVEGIQPHWINRMCSRMLHHKLQSYLNVSKWFIIIINVNYNLHH